ncbi:MAG: hypothetical protein AAF311_10435 [Pseudomonadota bacterium]
MTRFAPILAYWPVPIATLLCGFLVVATAAERVELPDWLVGLFIEVPGDIPPAPASPEPDAPPASPGISYAPAPGRDDRTPLPFVSQVFGLDDPNLSTKLSGAGPVLWDHAGQGTGALIARDVVLTTAHLFAEDGQWYGPFGLTEKPPAPSAGRIYLAACGRAYDFAAIELGSMAPRKWLGLDYAIARLVEPACREAAVLPVALTPDDLVGAEDQIMLAISSHRYADLPRYAGHPLYADRGTDRFSRYDVFGVRCKATGREDTGDVAEGSTAITATEGCDGVPGGSGGPLVLSRDGGASYAVVGVANSYRPDTEYNNWTRIEGAFAAHLRRLAPTIRLPDARTIRPDPASREEDGSVHGPKGPWVAMSPSGQEITR